MRQVVGMTLRFMRRNWYWYLLVATGLVAASELIFRHGSKSASVGLLVAAIYLCLPVYRSFISDDHSLPQSLVKRAARPTRRYFWMSIVIFFLSPFVLAFVPETVLAFGDPALFAWLTAPTRLGVFIQVVAYVSLLVTLSLIGTSLPAAVAGDLIGLRASFARGRRSFWTVLCRLILGPCLLGSIAIVLLVVLSVVPIFALYEATAAVSSQAQAHTVKTVVEAPIVWEAVVLGIETMATLTIAVLCRSYLDTRSQLATPLT